MSRIIECPECDFTGTEPEVAGHWSHAHRGPFPIEYSEETRNQISELTQEALDDEALERLSEARTGYEMPDEVKERISETLSDRTLPDDHKRAISEALDQDAPSEYPSEFSERLRDYIRARNGYLCYGCGKPSSTNRALDVHHLDRDRKNNDHSNLLPLCRSCHLMYEELARERS